MEDLRRVAVAPNEAEAEVICGLLRTDGIKCFYRQTDIAQAVYEGSVPSAGWQEVVVATEDAARAREILAAAS
jgi:hypothetical protein